MVSSPYVVIIRSLLAYAPNSAKVSNVLGPYTPSLMSVLFVMIVHMLHGIEYGGNAVVEYTVRDATKTVGLDPIGVFFDGIPFDDGKDD